jgi:hypothetical protein
MKKCIKCNSIKLLSVCGHSRDSFDMTNLETGEEYDGYVPEEIGIGGGDDVEFIYCANCGQIQGAFPVNAEYVFKDGDW